MQLESRSGTSRSPLTQCFWRGELPRLTDTIAFAAERDTVEIINPAHASPTPTKSPVIRNGFAMVNDRGLVLRQGQVEALAAPSMARSRELVKEWLLVTYPERFALVASVGGTVAVEHCIDTAIGLGFTTVDEAVRYLECAFRFSGEFPEGSGHAAYADILYDPGSSPDEKLRSLEAAVFPEEGGEYDD